MSRSQTTSQLANSGLSSYGYKFSSGAASGPYTISGAYTSGGWALSSSASIQATIGAASLGTPSSGVTSGVLNLASTASSGTIDLAPIAAYSSNTSITGAYSVKCMAYNGSNQYVAVHELGFISYASSINGTWTMLAQVATGNGGPAFEHVIWDGSKYIAVTSSNYAQVWTSSNGTTWANPYTAGNSYNFNGIANNGTSSYVIVGNNNNLNPTAEYIWTSTNGTSWSVNSTFGPASNSGLYGGNKVAYGNGTYVILNMNPNAGSAVTAYTSSSANIASTWTATAVSAFTGTSWRRCDSLIFDGTNFLALVRDSTNIWFSTSSNGTTWTTPVAITAFGTSIQANALVSNTSATYKYVVTDNYSNLYESKDGVTWVRRGNSGIPTSNTTGRAFFLNNTYVMSNIGQIVYSTDAGGTISSDVNMALIGPTKSYTTVI
jgi:hypothetical protein